MNSGEGTRARRMGRRRVLASLLLALPCWPLRAAPAGAAPFVMGIDHNEATLMGRWMRRVYTEAFRRLGMPLQFADFPTLRLSNTLERGAVDGEPARFLAYAAAHPSLVRVDEPVFDAQLALFAATPAPSLSRLEDLPGTSLRVEYRRGLVACEVALKPWQPAGRLRDVTTTEEGLDNLLRRPTTLVHCDSDVAFDSAIRMPRFKAVNSSFRQLLAIGQPQPLYPFLHRSNAELAPRLAAVLKVMKAEGLIQRYRREVERELDGGP